MTDPCDWESHDHVPQAEWILRIVPEGQFLWDRPVGKRLQTSAFRHDEINGVAGGCGVSCLVESALETLSISLAGVRELDPGWRTAPFIRVKVHLLAKRQLEVRWTPEDAVGPLLPLKDAHASIRSVRAYSRTERNRDLECAEKHYLLLP